MAGVTEKTLRIRYAIALTWFFAMLLWPKMSNLPLQVEDSSSHLSHGEGLYKAKITNANFGLLGVEFYESNENKKRWHILSKFAELHRKENYAYMKDVTANFYAERSGNLIVTKSDYGRSWTDKNLVELEGNISIESQRGYLFTMEHLNYNGATHEFQTEDVVNMRGPNVKNPSMLLKGTGLAADIDQEHFILKRSVTGQKRMKRNEWIKINAKSGEFFTNESRAVFLDDVRAELPKAQIRSDIFEIAGADENETLEARGNVVLKNRDRTGRAENAYLETDGDKITLEGNARIESKDNLISGRRIIMYTDSDRIEVIEAEGSGKH